MACQTYCKVAVFREVPRHVVGFFPYSGVLVEGKGGARVQEPNEAVL
jgi:hypothetical protein